MTTAGETAPTGQSRYSLEALQQSRPAKAVAGVVLAVIVAAIVWAIIAAFTGTFTDVVRIKAELPVGSNAVTIASPVEYRNVTVGKIGTETQAPGGGVAVEFEIYPKNLPLIPKGVQAQVAPLSIFGNQYVNLVPPAHPTTGHLAAGDFVPPYGGAPSSSLQGTVTQLYNLLNALHPADLDVALTSFAEALNGEGTSLGQALSGSARYLGGAVVPNLANVGADFTKLTPFSDTLNAAAPDVIGTVSNSATTARTITEQEHALHDLLTNGTTAVGHFGDILSQVQATLPSLMNESGPLLADVTQSPDELARTLSGLTQFASAVAAQEQSGPFLSVNVNLPVADISAGVNAALGYDNPTSVDQALGAAVNPPTYTAANCPQYPGETNPFCGTGGSPDATPTASSAGPVSPLGAPVSAQSTQSAPSAGSPADPTASLLAASDRSPTQAEVSAAQAIAAALDGGQPPASPALATVVLLPLLSSLTAP
ncbi:MAG TPA: MCE family protein [Acidimicrobiales bacterium]|nr:MCE family protein [Acidimicrobiales bacterium]